VFPRNRSLAWRAGVLGGGVASATSLPTVDKRSVDFPVILSDGSPMRLTVFYSSTRPRMVAFDELEDQAGVFVSQNVATDFDFSLPTGFYWVKPNIPVQGESLDLAFLYAGLGVTNHGLVSADVNGDGTISPIRNATRKRRLLWPQERDSIYG